MVADPQMLAMLARDQRDASNGRVTVLRPSGGSHSDGMWSPETETVYEGWALIRPQHQQYRQDSQADEPLGVSTYEAWVGGDVRVGDLVTVDESRDSALEGRGFYVVDVAYDELKASRRLVIREERDV